MNRWENIKKKLDKYKKVSRWENIKKKLDKYKKWAGEKIWKKIIEQI